MYLQMPTEAIAAARRWTACELLLWMDIYTMQVGGRPYFKTNQAMADLLHTDVRQVRRAIQQLTQCGAVVSTSDNNQRMLTAQVPVGGEDKSDRGQICPGTNLVVGEDKSGRGGGQICPGGRSNLSSLILNKSISEYNKSIPKRAPAHIRARAREEVVMPFEDEGFLNAWAVWVQDRSERRIKKYTQRGEQAALHNLYNISGGDPQTAVAIIHQSIQHSWHGLFQLKSANAAGPKDDGRVRGQAASADDIARLVATKRR